MSGPKPTQNRDELYDIVAAIMQSEDNGEAIEPQDWMARYPSHAESISAYFQAAESISDLAGPTAADMADRTSIPNGPESAGLSADTWSRAAEESIGSPKGKNELDVQMPTEFGRYRIERILGQGGMGAVYLAHDITLHRDVALKIPKFPEGETEELVERFLREARSAATLRHPNICPVFDVGEFQGQRFITMAYIQGRPLSDLIDADTSPAQSEVVRIIRKLAEALAEAHSQGVIHRDLKPANVMIDAKEEPVLMDFGLARFASRRDVLLTQDNEIVGTPAYMSPEQARGEIDQISSASDIYSLGVLLYQLLTGELPFQGNLVAVLTKIAVSEPMPPSLLRDDLHPRLAAACMKMMAKQPKDRFASMHEVIDELAAISELLEISESTGAPPIVVQSDTVAVLPLEHQTNKLATQPATSKPKKSNAPPRRRVWMAVACAAGAMLLLGAIVLLIPSKKGTLRIEINDPQIEVSIKDTQFIIKGADAEDVSLTPGEHVLRVKRGDFEFETKSLQLRKGETVVVKVEMLDGKVQVASGGRVIGQSAAPGNVAPRPNYALQFKPVPEGMPKEQHRSQVDVPSLKDTTPSLTMEVWTNGPVHNEKWSRRTIVQNSGILSFHARRQIGGNQCFSYRYAFGHYDGADRKLATIDVSVEDMQAVGPVVHLAAVRDADKGEFRFYVDGRLIGRHSRDIKRNASENLRLGGGYSPYTGWMDEVRISSVARYEENFTPARRFESDEHTVALYHFDEGTGDVLKDSSGNGHHGKITGAEWVRVDGSVPKPTSPIAPEVDENEQQTSSENSTLSSRPVNREAHAVATWVIANGGAVTTAATDVGVLDRKSYSTWTTTVENLPANSSRINGVYLPIESKEVAERLGDLAAFESLHALALNLNSERAYVASELPGLAALSSLRYLHLQGRAVGYPNRMNGAFLKYVTNLTLLTHLDLQFIVVRDLEMPYVSNLVALESLLLSEANISDEGLEQILPLTKLTRFGCYNMAIGDEGMQHLSQLQALESLMLQKTHITDRGLKSLESLPRLKEIWLYRTDVTVEGINEFRKAQPQCSVN